MRRRTERSWWRLLVMGWVVALLHGAIARAEIHSSLQVRYRLDDLTGQTATDSSTNTGRNGTLTNGAQFISGGRIGGAADLAGDNDFIDCPAITATDGAQKLTVAFWLNTDSRADSEVVLSKYLDTNNQFSIQFGTSGSGDSDDLVIFIATSSTVGYVYTTGNVLSNGTWIHVAVVYDGSLTGNTNRCKVFINGVQQIDSRIATSGNIPATLLSSASDHWYIGWRDNQPTGLALDGKVDEFHLYTRALTAGDIQELYLVESDGSILFNGSLTAPNSKLENTSASLLGSSDELTFCAWLYPTGPGEIATTGGVAFALDETASNFLLYHATSGENVTFLAGYATAPNLSTFAVPNNVWTPVAISHKYTAGSTPTIRVNFQSVTPTQSGPSGNPFALGNGYCIGNVTSMTNTWAGRIAHVQVFNRLLSASEMDACLKDPGAVRQNLRLWLPMTSANDVTDRSGNGFNWTGTALETSNGPHYDARFHYGVTDETIGQLAIPPNGNEPAIGVRGVGTRTKLTASSSLTGGARLITTKGYDFYPSTVIEPTVRDLYLYGKQDIPDHFVGDTGTTPVCHAIMLDGDAPTVSGCRIFDFRGDAIAVRNTTTEYSRMIRMPRVVNNKISHCWVGIRADAVDTQVEGNRVASCRDYGLLDSAGSVQSSGNHFFGMKTAIQFEGGPSRSVNDRFSDAKTGFYVGTNASGSDILGGTTEHCWSRNIDVHAQRVHIGNTRIFVANSSTQHAGIIGCDLHYDGSRAVMTDCEVRFPDYTFGSDTGVTGSTGVYVQQHNARIENLQLTGSSQAGETGVRILNDRNSIYVSVSSAGNGVSMGTGFGNTSGEYNDELVLFDTDTGTNTISGIVYVVYEEGEVPVRIDNTWTSALRIFTRVNTSSTWVELTPGTAYPQ